MPATPTYEELLRENATLRKEIADLRAQVGKSECTVAKAIPTSEYIPAPIPTEPFTNIIDEQLSLLANTPKTTVPVHMHSTPKEKIAFFMERFAGRVDVYARRYVSKKTGKAGYTPVCANEWVRGICEKPTVKCAKCPNRHLLQLTAQVIDRHLRGKSSDGQDVVGVYPMLADETCRFLVADFDDECWQADVIAFRTVCAENSLPVAIERSRSGNGAHAWFFFASPVPCVSARRLASALLTDAMERRHDLDFKSYDRLLPNQDTMPNGGFGNLIALPLQGLARKSGNSMFVDEQWKPYPDQWAYLSSLPLIAPDTVTSLLCKLAPGSELGTLARSEQSEPNVKPWEKTPAATPLSAGDFRDTIELVRANGVYIPKTGCSERALNRVKRLAAFNNPDFYRAQSMRLPIYNKPRVICTAVET
jgi:hypothetical protein